MSWYVSSKNRLSTLQSWIDNGWAVYSDMIRWEKSLNRVKTFQGLHEPALQVICILSLVMLHGIWGCKTEQYNRSSKTVQGYVEEAFVEQSLLVFHRMSSHSCSKNRSWCTEWESQQERRKQRPGSQISSVSSAVFIWPDALAGPHDSSYSELATAIPFVLPYSTSQGHSSATKDVLNKYLWMHCASGKHACLAVFRSFMGWLLLSYFCPRLQSPLFFPYCAQKRLHYLAWELLFACLPTNYCI